MPVYQYTCTECGEPLEVRQSFTDDALTVCPVCEGRLRKVLSAVGVVFKGSGFYRTDSRTGSAAKDGDAPKPEPVKATASASDTSSSGATTSETSRSTSSETSRSTSSESSGTPSSSSSGPSSASPSKAAS